jgi:hypothetical protein
VTVRPLAPKPGEPDLSLVTIVPAGVLYQVSLELSDPERIREIHAETALTKGLLKAVPFAVLAVATTVLFGVLLFKRRLHFRIGLALGTAAAATMAVGGLPADAASGGAWATAAILVTYAASVTFLVAGAPSSRASGAGPLSSASRSSDCRPRRSRLRRAFIRPGRRFRSPSFRE